PRNVEFLLSCVTPYHLSSIFFFFMLLPPRSTLFPYTTLFRSYLWRWYFTLGMSSKAFATTNSPCVIADADETAKARMITTVTRRDRKSTRLNSSHVKISYAVFCLKKKREGI